MTLRQRAWHLRIWLIVAPLAIIGLVVALTVAGGSKP